MYYVKKAEATIEPRTEHNFTALPHQFQAFHYCEAGGEGGGGAQLPTNQR